MRARCRRRLRRQAQGSDVLRQRTLKESIRATGIGLHGGKRVEMTLRQAPANAGITFPRVDLDSPVDCFATAPHVTQTTLRSTLEYANP